MKKISKQSSIVSINKAKIILFALFLCTTIIGNAQNQKINLPKGTYTFQKVFQEIEKQTNLSVDYNQTRLDMTKQFSFESTGSLLSTLLNELLGNSGFTYSIERGHIIIKELKTPFSSNETKRQITGTVTDERGEPIIGANVVEKGTLNGTVTDINGEFSLLVSDNTTLEITYIGFTKQDKKVGKQSSLLITLLEDSKSLDEVVVVGYGTQRKVTLTGSVVAVKGEEIVKSPSMNVTNSLIGKLPGVIINNRSGQPGKDDPSILIRGKSTLGDTSPLILIDGVERGGLGQLNPNDIQSISVLKDASAAIYGARAANGVILVTTKRGTNEKPTIQLSFDQGFAQATRNPVMADSYTFANVYNEIEVGEGRAPRYTSEELEKFRNGTDPNYANTDWYNTMLRKASPQHRTSLSVSGGSDRATYYLSLGELYQGSPFKEGTLKNRQYSLRSNVDVKVTDWLKIGFDLSGRIDDSHYPIKEDDTYSHIYLSLPTWTLYWPGTKFIKPNRDNTSLLNRVTDDIGTKENKKRVFASTFTFRIDIPQVKGLWTDGNFSYDASSVHEKSMNTPFYVYYQDAATGEYTKGLAGSSPTLANLNEKITQYSFLYLNVKLNYQRTFGAHTVGAMAGYEQSYSKSNYLEAYRSDFLSPSIPQISAGSSDKNKQSNGGNATESARQNVFTRLSYDYLSKYMVEFTFRVDGSANFPKRKRFGYFPGVTAGWRLSEENFMRNVDWLDNLKIRASYGKMGNDIVKAFQYLTVYGYGSNYVIGNNDVTGLVQSGVPNPNITWEVANTYNAGIEAQMWNGLLGVELDLFKTNRSNILRKRNASIPAYTGLVLPDENIAKVNNKGFELVLTHQNNKNDLKYSLASSFSYARNKITFMDEQPGAEPYQLETGKPMGSGLYYKALGIFASEEEINSYPHLLNAKPGDVKYEDVNDDGEINSRDMVRINQSPTPEIVYTLSGNFQYKGFDMSVLFQGQERAKVSFADYFRSMSHNVGNFTKWRADGRWTPENIHAKMPRADLAQSNANTYDSSLWLFNAGFLRLKNLEIGYTIPQTLCRKIGIEKTRFYVSGSNLLILYDHMKNTGLDPEATSYWYYPPQRIYNIGINLTF